MFMELVQIVYVNIFQVIFLEILGINDMETMFRDPLNSVFTLTLVSSLK